MRDNLQITQRNKWFADNTVAMVVGGEAKDECAICSTVFETTQAVRIAFVTNFCAHYRVRTFETLAKYQDTDFFFSSGGEEWYWQREHGIRVGNFRYEYLPAIQVTQRLRLVPSLVTRLWRKNYDVYIKCINGRFALPVTYLIAKLRRKPFILWTGIWMTLDTRFHRLVFPLTLRIYRHADAIVVYGEHVKRYLTSLKIAPEKIFIAAHAMDNSMYNRVVSEQEKLVLRAKLNLDTKKTILYFGRLEEVKGLHYLIEAFALLKSADLALIIAGDGSLRKNLESLAREQGVEKNVCFVGYVPPEMAPTYYAIADLLVLPSVTTPTGKETWGLVVNEAMNQGVPVVATDAVGAAAGGLVQHGVNGFIVPERDTEALAQGMARILTDLKLRKHLSDNARRIVAEWDNERMVKGFREAIHYAIEHNGSRKQRMRSRPSEASLLE
jgi:glycosyltransferase involved in cell wall biosynthesis